MASKTSGTARKTVGKSATRPAAKTSATKTRVGKRAAPATAKKKPATKARRLSGKSAVAAAGQSVAARLPPVSAAQTSAARKKFEQGIVARAEAVPAGKPLPPGATHEIVGKRADGTPVLKRKRFSLT